MCYYVFRIRRYEVQILNFLGQQACRTSQVRLSLCACRLSEFNLWILKIFLAKWFHLLICFCIFDYHFWLPQWGRRLWIECWRRFESWGFLSLVFEVVGCSMMILGFLVLLLVMKDWWSLLVLDLILKLFILLNCCCYYIVFIKIEADLGIMQLLKRLKPLRKQILLLVRNHASATSALKLKHNGLR